MKNIDKVVLIRTIVLAIALINQTLVMFGWSPIPYSNEEIEYALTSLFTVVAGLWAWWKNNSFSQEAIQSDEYLKELKKKKQDK